MHKKQGVSRVSQVPLKGIKKNIPNIFLFGQKKYLLCFVVSQGCFKEVSKSVREVSIVFQEIFKGISRKFQGFSRKIEDCFKVVFSEFHGFLKEVQREF